MRSQRVRSFLSHCLLLGIVAGSIDASAQPPAAAGSRLVDYIESLRAAGMTIVASSELVTDSMRLQQPPPEGEPVEQLRAVLATFDLALAPGPRGGWLVIRAQTEAPVPSRESANAVSIAVPEIETIIVTASRYTLTRDTDSTQRIDRLQLEQAPVLGDDALRTIHGLPGVTSSGLSARTNVRGGVSDETLFLLDGVRLYKPFHLKDFESLFSSISPRLVESIDVHTGGYPARFGERMSGVIDVRSIEPTERRHYELGVSTLTSSFQSSGRFADGRGLWLTSIRRGNLDLLIDAAESDIGTPRYVDLFTKLEYELADGQKVGGGVLAMSDDITLREDPSNVATADYDDTYTWLRFEHSPSSRIDARYLLTRVRIAAERDGRMDEPQVAIGELREARGFDVDTVEADWAWSSSERQRLEWGARFSRVDADYDVVTSRSLPYPIDAGNLAMPANQIATNARLGESHRSMFVNYRFRPADRWTFELGSRWDQQSYLDDEQLSPRLGMLFDVGDRTSLRASWGRFFQAQSLSELEATDGQAEPMRAQESEHTILSLEHRMRESLSLRLELYDKRFERVRERHENLFMRVSLLPELLPDRVALVPTSARARGLEIGLEGDTDRWRWWLSLVRHSAKDMLVDGEVRRSWEEPWSGKGGFIWSGARWSASTALTLRSGWPISPLELVDSMLAVRRPNGEAFETFRSLDLRFGRVVALARGSIEFSFELTNALNFENECCFDYSLDLNDAGQIVGLRTDVDYWLSTVPTLGFLWTFGAD